MLYIKLMSAHPNLLSKGSLVLVALLKLVAIGSLIYVATRPTTSKGEKTGLFIAAGFIAIFFALFLCLVWCFYSEFEVAIQIVDTAADFYNATKRQIFVSCWVF